MTCELYLNETVIKKSNTDLEGKSLALPSQKIFFNQPSSISEEKEVYNLHRTEVSI